MPYVVVLFLHIAGAVATFAGVAVLLATMRRAKRTEELSSIGWIYEIGSTLGLAGIVLVAATGLYMAASVWGLGRGWIVVAIIAFAALAPIGPIVVGPRIERVLSVVRSSPDGPLPDAARDQLMDPIPKLGLLLVLGDLAGIVFVMTTKPPAAGAVVAIVAFVLITPLLGLPVISRAIGRAVEAFARLERRSPLYRR